MPFVIPVMLVLICIIVAIAMLSEADNNGFYLLVLAGVGLAWLLSGIDFAGSKNETFHSISTVNQEYQIALVGNEVVNVTKVMGRIVPENSQLVKIITHYGTNGIEWCPDKTTYEVKNAQ